MCTFKYTNAPLYTWMLACTRLQCLLRFQHKFNAEEAATAGALPAEERRNRMEVPGMVRLWIFVLLDSEKREKMHALRH